MIVQKKEEKKMKKALAVLLVFAMLFAWGCQGENKKNDDKYKAIEPIDGEHMIFIPDPSSGLDDCLTRIDKSSNSLGDNAKVVLDVIYEDLESRGITSYAKDVYGVAYEAMDPLDEADVYKVFLNDESIEPVFVVILRDIRDYTGEDYCLIGSFTEEALADGLRSAVMQVVTDYREQLTKDLGFLRDDVEVRFPITITRDLAFAKPSAEQITLYERTKETFEKYTLAEWKMDGNNRIIVNGAPYDKIIDSSVFSMETLGKYLSTSFTERVIKQIDKHYSYLKSGNNPVYIEQDGYLYVQGIGLGAPMSFKSVAPKYTALQGDSRLFMIIESEWAVFDSGYNEIGTTYKEDLIVFEKTDGDWKCDHYTEVPFGNFVTSFKLYNGYDGE